MRWKNDLPQGGLAETAKPLRRPFQCVVQAWHARHNKTTESPCHSTKTLYWVLQTTPTYYKVRQRTTQYHIYVLLPIPYYKVLRSNTKYFKAPLQSAQK